MGGVYRRARAETKSSDKGILQMMKKRGYGAIIAVVLLTAILFAGFWGTWGTVVNYLEVPSASQSTQVPLTIQPGESVQQIADTLQKKGLIRNALIFRLWARIKGLDTSIQAGVYNLTPGLSLDALIARLQNGRPDAASLLVISGWRLEQIAAQIDSLNLKNFSKQDFLNFTHHPDQFPDKGKYPLLNGLMNMEGLLFPDTYAIPTGATTVQIIDMMLDQLNTVINQNKLVALAQQHNLNEYQMLTLASIVQREASNDGQMPLIAGIYWKRVNQPSNEIGGPFLQSDPTVEYAYDTDHPPAPGADYWVDLNKYGQGNTIDTGSPWNSYTHSGWPPTPISSPGLAALQAAASPQQTNCYFFLTDPKTGKLVCEPTYRQFQQDVQKYLQH